MSQQVVRDTYQANGLIKSLGHPQSSIASSQTSLQKLPASSPQFLYQAASNNNNNRHQQQQQMQFHQQQPNMQQTVTQFAPPPQKPAKSDSTMNSLLVPQQASQLNGMTYSVMPSQYHQQPPPPSLNGISNSNNNLMQPMIMPTPIMSTTKDTQLDQQLAQQVSQSNSNLNSQAPVAYQIQQQPISANGPQQQQYITQSLQQQVANNVYDNQQQQPVPITTVMIPASAAAQIQSASMQIQQAALQASGNNPQLQQSPQIFVFMIPYMTANGFPQQQQQQQQLPPTLPTTPEQGSLNSTLVRQSHQSVYVTRQQQQQQTATNQSNHHQIQNQTSASHSRAVSSLSISKTKSEPEKFYIKANFSYQATRNRQELSFQKGDILHVLDTLQNNKDYGIQYWLATRVKPNGEDAEKGLIPNKNKAEAIALEQRTMNVGEGNGTLDGSSGGVLSASVGRVNFLKRRAAQRSKSLCKDNWDNVVFDIGSFKLPTYERVIFKHPGFCRPVVIFGPLSDIAREKLLRDYPEKYSYPTGLNQTAPDHPKVIRIKGVVDVIDQGKHALLDITAPAVEKLNFANLAPIVISMKTDSKSIIKEFRARAAKSLDPNACDEDTLRRDGKSSRKLLEQSVKLEKQWSHVFTAVLDLSTMGSEMWYRKLRETIENQQSANVWMSDKKSDKKLASLSAANSASSAQASQLNATGCDSIVSDRMSMSLMNNNSNGVSQHQQQSSANCLPADSSSMLSDRFNDCLNISSTKSTNDLQPMLPTTSEVIYGNRSQMRNAYAHSLAQKLARASSEPKLNGLLSDNDIGDDDDHDEDDDDNDDDDDDDIIKKPFPPEFENSSSISSSNGCGQCSLTSGISGTANASSANPLYQVHYQIQQQQQQQQQQQMQHQQSIIKPPAPPPPPPSINGAVDNSAMSLNGNNNVALMTNRTAIQASQLLHQQQPPPQECIYNSFANMNTNRINQYNSDYHPLPSLTPQNSSNENGFDTSNSSQHHQQRHNSQLSNGSSQLHQHHQQLQNQLSQHQQNLNNSNNLQQHHSISASIQANLKNNNNIIDLSRNHEARGSAFQVYSDMNQNNYHYYNLNKI